MPEIILPSIREIRACLTTSAARAGTSNDGSEVIEFEAASDGSVAWSTKNLIFDLTSGGIFR